MPEELSIVKTEPKQEIKFASPKPFAFAPSNFNEAVKLSQIIAESGLAPKGFEGNPKKIFVALQMGAEVGLAPMQALQNIAVINGRPSLWGDAALAVVQAHSEYEWHKEWFEGEGNARTAIFQIKRKLSEVHEVRFSIADAARAGLLMKDTYKAYPDRMIQMRARGFGLRDKFADALRGLSIAEEAIDIPSGPTLDGGDPAPAEDPEKELRAEADALLQKYYPEMNAAKRQMQISRYQGRMPELLEKLRQNGAQAKEATVVESNAQSQERTGAREEPKAPRASEHPKEAVRQSQPVENIHGVDITDDDLPDNLFDQTPPKAPAPAVSHSPAQPAPGSKKGWDF